MIVILYENGIEFKRGQAKKIYPFKDMGQGYLTRGLEWKILAEPLLIPVPTELEKRTRTEVDNNKYHSVHKHLKQIDVVYTITRKTDDEITQLLENVKKNANASIIGFDTDQDELIILTLYALLRLSKGKSVPQKANVLATIIEGMAQKIISNSDNLDAKLQDLANIIDINSGFDNG